MMGVQARSSVKSEDTTYSVLHATPNPVNESGKNSWRASLRKCRRGKAHATIPSPTANQPTKHSPDYNCTTPDGGCKAPFSRDKIR